MKMGASDTQCHLVIATWKCKISVVRSSKFQRNLGAWIFKCEMSHFSDVGRICKNIRRARGQLGAASG